MGRQTIGLKVMEEYEVMEAAQKLIHWWECANEQYADLQPELPPDELGPPPPNVGVELLRQYVEMNKDELLRIEEFEKRPKMTFHQRKAQVYASKQKTTQDVVLEDADAILEKIRQRQKMK